MTSQEIYAIKPDKYDWRELPNGNHVILGNHVLLRDDVTLGNRVILGHRVLLGHNVILGDNVKLGDDVILGHNVKLGDNVILGNRVKLGNHVQLEKTPLQIQCHPYIVYPYSKTQIGVGCIVHEIEYWLRGEPKELIDHPVCNPWSNYLDAIIMIVKYLETLK